MLFTFLVKPYFPYKTQGISSNITINRASNKQVIHNARSVAYALGILPSPDFHKQFRNV